MCTVSLSEKMRSCYQISNNDVSLCMSVIVSLTDQTSDLNIFWDTFLYSRLCMLTLRSGDLRHKAVLAIRTDSQYSTNKDYFGLWIMQICCSRVKEKHGAGNGSNRFPLKVDAGIGFPHQEALLLIPKTQSRQTLLQRWWDLSKIAFQTESADCTVLSCASWALQAPANFLFHTDTINYSTKAPVLIKLNLVSR